MSEYDSADEIGSLEKISGMLMEQWDDQVRPYIEMIDYMRRIGIDREFALPSIAVVGDQSSGKSSVLEALSGVSLPRGSGIVTRCPLELKLRTQTNGRHWKAVISYKDTQETFTDPTQVESSVRKAQNMLAGDGVGICDELISLEITSPDVCDLTLIDLPGITRVAVKDQPENIGDQIRQLILQFISKKETIILVVVPSNIDIATTEALQMAQSADPEGLRTLAILTKPDLVDRGAEMDVLQVLQGKVVPLKKGFIMVKCRGQSDINEKLSLAEATRREREFFTNHPHFSYLLDEQRATTSCLATRLTKELVEHIKSSLPSLRDQIQLNLSDANVELKTYDNGPPLEPEDMGPFLSKKILEFSDQISELSRTGESENGNIYFLLRPVFTEWEQHLRNSKTSFKESVTAMTERYDDAHRGRELVTFSDYSAFESMVKKHVEDLKQPALETMRFIRGIIQKEFQFLCDQSFPNYPNLRHIVESQIDEIHSKQESKVETRIHEYIDMEKLVYTQDPIFTQKIVELGFVEKRQSEELNVTLDTGENATSARNCAVFDTRNLTPEKLIIYYEIVYQRLADYIPMVILVFILKEAAVMLRSYSMDLRDGADVVKLLAEDTEMERQRAELLQRMKLLRLVQDRIRIYL